MYTHILLEVYCLRDEHRNLDAPDYCLCENNKIEFTPNYECLFNNCPFVAFTSHENALCYVNEKSEAEETVSLGQYYLNENSKCVPNNIELWRKIAISKIEEAYKEYEKLTENDAPDESAT